MRQFRVTSDGLELPRNTWFTLIHQYPWRPGSLVAFRIGRHKSIGRWKRDSFGRAWLLLPGLALCLVGRAVQILGEVVLDYAASGWWKPCQR